jgi:hypothetical protein
MAVFKKVPDSQPSGSPLDAITPEMVGQFATTYWPVVLGGLLLFVLVFRGYARLAYTFGILVVLLQAWWFGRFG